MKRIVKLIAIDARYKDKTPYPYRCIFDENIGTYLTGQHIDPTDPDTLENLTLDEMTGKVPVVGKKREKFPFVINPENPIKFKTTDKFDLSTDGKGEFVNARDKAMHNLLFRYGWFVANTKDSVIPRTHYFYLSDEIAEAQKRLTSTELAYEAEKYVREELSPEGIKDLALVLSYKIPSFFYDAKTTTDVVVEDKVLTACRNTPEKILEAKTEAYNDELFVLKLAHHDVITRKGTDFYYGSEFLGGDLDAVKRYMKMDGNIPKVSKWNRQLSELTGVSVNKKIDADLRARYDVFYEEIKTLSLDDLKKLAGSKRYRKDEWDGFTTTEELQQYLLSKLK